MLRNGGLFRRARAIVSCLVDVSRIGKGRYSHSGSRSVRDLVWLAEERIEVVDIAGLRNSDFLGAVSSSQKLVTGLWFYGFHSDNQATIDRV